MNAQERNTKSWAEQAWEDWRERGPGRRGLNPHRAYVDGYNAGLARGVVEEQAATSYEVTEGGEASPVPTIEIGIGALHRRIAKLEKAAEEWRQDSNYFFDQIEGLEFELRIAHSVLPRECKHAD